MKCKNCGNEFANGHFCPNCGVQMDGASVTNSLEPQEDVLKQKKIDKKAKISLILGIVTLLTMTTIIIPLVSSIWSIVDGVKALKGKTKCRKCAIGGIILSSLFYLIFISGFLLADAGLKEAEKQNTEVVETEMIESETIRTEVAEVDTTTDMEEEQTEETSQTEIKQTEMEHTEKEEVVAISGDLYDDAENALLYSNEYGNITDKHGNILSEYIDFTVNANGSITDGEVILEGIFAGAGGKIIIQIPEEVVYDDTINPQLAKLKAKANESACMTEIIVDESWLDTDYPHLATEVADDGSYFDEVVLGAWYDEHHVPIATKMPARLRDAVYAREGNYAVYIHDFYFIDGERMTIDDIKRKAPNKEELYGLVLTDIVKISSSGNSVSFQAIDYISQTPVIVHGNFAGILNGDDILLFAEYEGLATDDTPNFSGVYVEVINHKELTP